MQLAVLHGSPGAPTTTLWFTVPAIIVLVLPLFARRRFPFAGPAAYWVLAAAITFVDGVLLAWVDSLGVVGLAAALLLGYLRDRRKAVIGLGIVVGAMLILVWNIPGPQPASWFIFIHPPVRGSVDRGLRSSGAPEDQVRRPKYARSGQRTSASQRHALPWPRSAPASPASSTTSSPTRSA